MNTRLTGIIVCTGLLLAGCSNNEQKQDVVNDSSTVVTAAGDSVVVPAAKPSVSVTDSVKQLEEKDTASKMINKAPEKVEIHLDSIK